MDAVAIEGCDKPDSTGGVAGTSVSTWRFVTIEESTGAAGGEVGGVGSVTVGV